MNYFDALRPVEAAHWLTTSRNHLQRLIRSGALAADGQRPRLLSQSSGEQYIKDQYPALHLKIDFSLIRDGR